MPLQFGLLSSLFSSLRETVCNSQEPDSDSGFSLRSQIFTEQVELLYSHAPLSFVFTVLNGFLLAFFQRSLISTPVLLSWFSILLLVTLVRTVLVYLYHRLKSQGPSKVFWYRAYLVGIVLSGSVWGSAAIFLFPADGLEYQLFTVFILAGMTAAAVTVLAASLIAFFLFVLPTLLPLALQMFWHGSSSLSSPMAMLVLLYLLGLSIAARGMNRTLLTSLRLRFDNRELVQEVVERRVAEEALYQERERLQITFSAMIEGVIITDDEGLIEYLNPTAEKMSGWSNSQARGKTVEQVFTLLDESTGECSQAIVYECLKNANRSKKNSLLIAKGGKQRIIEEIATPLKDRTGNIKGAVAILRDVTQENEYSRQLAYQASHDSLTDLPNRTLLCDRLEHAIVKAIRANCLVAVLFMDLDRFKQINDSLGHAAGDLLLWNVAERLRASVRQEDTVARFGGDEFVVVLEGLTYENQATAVTEKIVDNMAIPLYIENQEISVRISIGIALFPRDGTKAETLLKNADAAMYRTKVLAQENFQFYTNEIGAQALDRLKLEQQLEQAVARDEFELYYQPRVDINNGKVVGLEALVRWRTSPNQLLSPTGFIYIAEETGSILKIGEWVLYSACRQTQRWHENGHTNLRIAVNISACQIRNANFADLVAKVLDDTGLAPELLELEITESLFLKDVELAISVLQDLKALGIKLSIDDFGTGYSSLTYLKLFPVDILKIDRSFISDIIKEPDGGAIIPAIIAMGHSLNLEVIAEGVENEIQRKYLSNLGCDGFQGYYFSKPLPEQEVINLLHNKEHTWQVQS